MRWWAVLAVVCILVLVVDFNLEPASPARAASTTFVVTSAADTAGTSCTTNCTLRQAISAANITGGPSDVDRITFNIPGAGVHTISPTTQLPFITQPVSIEGDTQPGASCSSPRTLLIEIVNGGTTGTGLRASHAIASENQSSMFRGMTVRGFSTYQVRLSRGSNHVVACMNIGTNSAGIAAAGPMATYGVYVDSFATGPTIGGETASERNIIGNSTTGVYVVTSFTDVLGNYIGIAANGTTPIPNTNGILIGANNVTIGGEEGNVISGNTGFGITGSGASIRITNNHIGVNAAGTAAVGNGSSGISLTASASPSIVGNQVGGNADGIVIKNSSSPVISFNAIGLDVTGMVDLGNSGSGIFLQETEGASIGVLGPNLIAGNGDYGIRLELAGGTTIARNVIGYAADLTTTLPNDQEAISIRDGILPTTIGGDSGGLENLIYSEIPGFDASAAILITEAGTGFRANVEVAGNSLRSDGHAINLVPKAEASNVVTPNDGPGDSDIGPNGLQNTPILSAAFPGTSTIIEGSLESSEGSYAVRFYANSTCDSAFARQAERYLGSITVTVPATGSVDFSNTLFIEVAEGEFITATATDELHNTSELSPCRLATNLVPTIGQFVPDRVVAGSSEGRIIIEGENFSEDVTVMWDEIEIVPAAWEATSLVLVVSRDEIGSSARQVLVAVKNQVGTSTAEVVFVVPSTSDVDCSGTASATDALVALKWLAGLEPGVTCSDNPDTIGGLTIADVLWIRQEVAGLIDQPFPLEP